MKRSEKKQQFLEVVLLLLPVFVVIWVRAGRGVPERWMFLGFTFYYAGYICWKIWKTGDFVRWTIRLLKDPLLYFGGGLILLLGVQWLNSGRSLVFNRTVWEWEYGLPPHPGWPSAINASEAQQWLFIVMMLVALVLAIRTLAFSRYQYRLILKLLVFNAGLLAVFGLLQFVSGTQKQYGFHYLPGYFFSVFGYPNQATSFFVLMFGLSCGLMAENVRTFFGGGYVRIRRLFMDCFLTLFCALGVVFSFSRAGLFLIGSQLAVSVAYFVSMIVRCVPMAKRINALLIISVLLLLFITVIYRFAKEDIEREAKSAIQHLSVTRLVDPPPLSLTGIRYPLWSAAMRIWKDYPWFGCGSWGYRYLKKIYTPREQWITKLGYANVHLDALQFLTEYGVVGFFFITGCVFVLFCRAFCWPFWHSSLYIFSFIGLLLVMLHSVIDLPFRSPAVSSHWLLIVAVLGSGKIRFTIKHGKNEKRENDED